MSQIEASELETTAVTDFIAVWGQSGAAERSNYQGFLRDLCDIIGAPRPEPAKADSAENVYVFEHPVRYAEGGTGFIDLYRRGAFILEAKQGSERQQLEDETGLRITRRARRGTAIRGTAGWDDSMLAAKGQAEGYARSLPETEELPPFLVVVDVGHSIELYADFARLGRAYTPFPDSNSHRIKLADLADPKIRERLRLVWTDPFELDPSRKSAEVTREVASRLAELARSFERSGHDPERVAHFLMRCLFTMFAEDVGLLPKAGFTNLLKTRRGKLDTFPDMLGALWATMDKGGFSPILEQKILRFNGELFAASEALPVTEAQLELLIHAAEANWESVEPAIFGTLLERALDPVERHKLGAHYTPRAYVERLVMPTIVEPLREEWEAAKTGAVALARAGKTVEARAEVDAFLKRLCSVTVLDPACGTGNFLYVTLEHLKRLEGEVRDVRRGFGDTQEAFEDHGLTVDPHQLLGIELNTRAAAIADLVLWIGYLQWHFRTFGDKMPAEPIIHAYHNIECRDAVLAYDHAEPVLDEAGNPVTRWDGRTTKPHPVTGEPVPDESAQIPVLRYVNPRKAEWPQADFVVGNPPFIGNKRMRQALGDGYVETLRKVHADVPDTSDYVMYWWDLSARLLRDRRILRFGFITTNSIRQPQPRKVLEGHMAGGKGMSLVFAIPDHPWTDAESGASVRIAMTVASPDIQEGILSLVVEEVESSSEDEVKVVIESWQGHIKPDLTIGANVAGAKPLKSNVGLSFMGITLVGDGFRLLRDDIDRMGYSAEMLPAVIRPYRSGKELTQRAIERWVIDFYGMTEHQALESHPALYQHLTDYVKPARSQNNRPSYRRDWFIFGEPRGRMRNALKGCSRFITTLETSKHRIFTFLDEEVLADHSLFAIALDDAFFLGVLSSRTHVVWSLVAGARLGVGNDPRWRNITCFDPFPFPIGNTEQIARIRELGEMLDAHRKRQQGQHPELTLTNMYNVLEKLRSGEALSKKEREVHERGLVSVLKQIHDDLDAAVFEAYGWSGSLSDAEILTNLVALNAERADEEARGLVRWLRPEFQNPEGRAAAQQSQGKLIDDAAADPAAAKKAARGKTPWPKTLADQAQAVRAALASRRDPVSSSQLAQTFSRARVDRIEELLEALVSLGQARALPDGRFAPTTPGR